MQRPAHRARALRVAALQIRAGDSVGEQGVAAHQRATRDEQAHHVCRVAGKRDGPQLDAPELEPVTVAQRRRPGPRRRLPRSRAAAGMRSRAPLSSARARAPDRWSAWRWVSTTCRTSASSRRGERRVDLRIGRGVDDERLASGDQQVREAAAARALDLNELEPRRSGAVPGAPEARRSSRASRPPPPRRRRRARRAPRRPTCAVAPAGAENHDRSVDETRATAPGSARSSAAGTCRWRTPCPSMRQSASLRTSRTVTLLAGGDPLRELQWRDRCVLSSGSLAPCS